jgi:hypothetical protein
LGIPWGITEYHMSEAIEYEGHMVQWRDLALQGCELVMQGMTTQGSDPAAKTEAKEKAREDAARAVHAQAAGAGLNPFMRPGLMECDTKIPRAYNGFVLRVC